MRFIVTSRSSMAVCSRKFRSAAGGLVLVGLVLMVLAALATYPAYGATAQAHNSALAAAPSVASLLAEARSAYAQHRIVAPAGHNAVYYYTVVLSRDPHNQVAVDALREIFPYAVPEVRRAIADRDVSEARREIALLARAEPGNYTLALLRGDLGQQGDEKAAAAMDTVGVHTLTVRASGTCWIEVRRLDNQIVDARMLRKGDVRTYRSDAPLRVTLGYANAVTVIADAKPLHLAPATPGNSEHLLLFDAGGPQLRVGRGPLTRERPVSYLAPGHRPKVFARS